MSQNHVEGTQIELGHALVTMVEPTRDPHDLAEYNRWYEYDHAYEGVLIGPGAFSFRRFVATRELKAQRVPGAAPVGSFIAAYWFMQGSVEEHFKWSFGAVGGLVAAGRMNPNRTHISTSIYDYHGAVNRRGWTVGPQVSLDHPYKGLVAMWCDRAANTSQAELERYLRDELAPKLTTGQVAQALTFTPRDMPGAPNSGVGVGDKVLTLFFLQRDPAKVFERHFGSIADTIAASGKGTLALAQPFIPVIPGTNTYLDQI